jgi:hypothetical protein
VLHAGSKEGFIPGAALIFSSKTNNGDYHGEMNEENFLTWFEEQLLKNWKSHQSLLWIMPVIIPRWLKKRQMLVGAKTTLKVGCRNVTFLLQVNC